MPIVELHLLQGYGAEDKRRLHQGLTDAVRLVVPAAPEAITVMIHEMEPANYSRGGIQRSGAAAQKDPGGIVKDFLDAMQRRDLESASAFLGEEFVMQFPGTAPMHALEELLAWAEPRYRFVKKAYQGFDVMQGPGLAAIVYCRGRLSGEWLDGTGFDGIRFIDRFEIENGRITRQDVWNDLAEVKASA